MISALQRSYHLKYSILVFFYRHIIYSCKLNIWTLFLILFTNWLQVFFLYLDGSSNNLTMIYCAPIIYTHNAVTKNIVVKKTDIISYILKGHLDVKETITKKGMMSHVII